MFKNVAGQKWTVFAFDETDNTAKTGDAGNITATISLDGATAQTVTDTNPVEHSAGYYVFDISQGESNADMLTLIPVSSTTSISVIGVPGTFVTVPENFNILVIDGSGYTSIVNIEGVSAMSQIQTATGSALTAYDAAQASSITALNDISQATVQTAVAAELATYGTAQASAISALNNISSSDVDTACQSALATYSAAQASAITALNNISTADIVTHTTSALTTYAVAQASAISALNDISQATVETAVANGLTAFGTAQASAISALNNISTGDVNTQCQSALVTYSAAQASAISALNNISANDVLVQSTSALTVYAVAQASTSTAIKAKTDNLPEGLQKNQAASFNILMREDDHETPLTGTAVTATRSIEGGAYASVAGSVTEIGAGTYRFTGTAADFNGDDIIFRFSNGGADDKFVSIVTNT